MIMAKLWSEDRKGADMAYIFDDDKKKIEVVISTEAPPATGEPNTIYIQIIT